MELALKRRVKAMTSLGFFAILLAQAGILRLLGLQRARLVILAYHGVPARMRHRFTRQLDLMRKGADAIVAADFCGPARAGDLLVALTFDDAFTSVVEHALPELATRGMPATIFAPSGMLGGTPGWEMESGNPDRTETIVEAEVLSGLCPDTVQIGAHGVTHARLPRIGHDAAAVEISASKAHLEKLLGREVMGFAFPYGEYDDSLVDLCRASGFRFAFTLTPEIVDPNDRAIVRGRVSVRLDDSPLELWLKMRGAYAWMRWASALKARVNGRPSPGRAVATRPPDARSWRGAR